MFETTLADLVTGIRSHKRDTALFISQSIADIKVELQSSDFFVKANALQKLTFLQMMGYSMSWAVFAAVEVMSSPRFALKRVGVLGICQGLDSPDRSPVVLLTTNLLKKELWGATVISGSRSGENIYHAGLAISCLSNIVTEDLGRETLPDLLHLLKHPSPYVRKKALLCLYKVFLKYPQGLRLSYDAIKSCLDDSHSSVVSCAVNVITELSDKNPRNYLPLAPAFFRLLTSSANNWMLIKVVKLLGSLVPEEPRLARKLLEPLSNIVKSTHAKSLLYEAVYAITLCLQYVGQGRKDTPSNSVIDVVELCVDTLRSFVSDPDQNLKYLGLVGFGSLLQSQPKVLHSQKTECRSLILKCLSDEDITIRTRALGLLRFMTTTRNLVDLITQLLGHVEAASGEYRCDLVQEIVRMCSSDKYELVSDFAWYFDVLLILAGVRGVDSQGGAIARQWMDVAWRVLPVRGYAVRRSLEVLVFRGPGGAGGGRGSVDGNDGHITPEVLPAAAWIVGEYSHLIPDALAIKDGEKSDPRYDAESTGPYHALIQSMTSPIDAAGINPLPTSTQAVFVQNAMKVFAAACERNLRTNREGNDSINLDNDNLECTDDELYACAGTLMSNLVVYSESPDVEVKERAFTSRQLLLAIDLPPDFSLQTATAAASIASKCRAVSSMLTYSLTPEPMKPLSAKVQQRKLLEGPPSPVSVEEWGRDVDWDAFPFLDEETPWFDGEGKVRGSVESISFTRQQTNNAATSRGTNSDGLLVGDAETASFGGAAIGHASLDSAIGMRTNITPSSLQKVADPFYLSASAAPTGRLLDTSGGGGSGDADKDAADAAAATRFGSIQLDSGGESDGYSGSKSKKKKKKKKTTKAVVPKHQKIVESDDEDDDNVPRLKRGGVSKEVHNLALVDLTTPLGEDEVMPRNDHYVVPMRPPAKSKSSPTKSKKKKDGKKQKSRREPAAVEGDLLGFDSVAFRLTGGNTIESDVGSAAMAVPSSSNNPINDAFDDLLGLQMPQSSGSSNTVVAGTAEEVKVASKEKKQKKDKHGKKSKKKKE